VENITRELMAMDGHQIIPIYFDGLRYRRVLEWRLETFTYISESREAGLGFTSGDIFLGLDLNHATAFTAKQELLYMSRYGVEVGFVLYDLLPIQFPSFWPKGFSEVHEEWILSCLEFDFIFVNSDSVRNDLVKLTSEVNLALDDSRVGKFTLGVNKRKKRTNVPGSVKSSLLMVGSLNHRRGHIEVIETLEGMWDRGFTRDLIIVGAPDPAGVEVEAAILACRFYGSRLKWYPNVSDSELNEIYESADSIIMASVGEGFGLPLIEAMDLGLKVVARDIPIFQEISQGQAVFFGVKSGQTLEQALEKLDDIDRAKIYYPDAPTWSQAARELMDALKFLRVVRD
jgi:glycosyltransferase involved in cell wall biosynthesis